MASITTPVQTHLDPIVSKKALPPLEQGDHLDQKTFHARYEAMPEDVRAELIGGVVYMSSPVRVEHSLGLQDLMEWLVTYKRATPGTQSHLDVTAILGKRSEPRPDACLLVVGAPNGQTKVEGGYVVGAPELIAEVASSTESYDLHSKKRDYELAGVKEYVVVALRQEQVFWFISRERKFDPLPPGSDGILRSEVFPGLWLDPAALLRQDHQKLKEVLHQGLATPEHAAWVAKLANPAS